ncbi:tubulin-tyrosine ligase family-domain-containing protein [Scenedesmus sp. NREL 46B-D3]|nr:tubulin-tyrosine ligase family-domain-containing protein [Scenedesmus sp. NREL 46B-D3]
MLFAAGGTRTGGNFKAAAAPGPMGWQVADSWDVLWSTSDGALKASSFLKQGQLISTLPGTDCLSKKRHLAVTLHAAYGEEAWSMLPRTYSIPAQLQQFRQRLQEEAAAIQAAAAAAAAGSDCSSASNSVPRVGSGADSAAAAGRITGYYVLKTAEHLGQGLQVVPSSKALSALLERNKPYLSPPRQQQQQQQGHAGAAASLRPQHSQTSSSVSSRHSNSTTSSGSDNSSSTSSSGSSSSCLPMPPAAATAAAGASVPRPFICVQQYITNPLLVQGRKFGLRLWVLALGPKPFRAYLYHEGLVLFSKEQYNADLEAVQAHGAATQGHLTNHAQNTSGQVWPLQQLLSLLGPAAAATLQQQLAATAGRVLAAAAGPVRQAAQELRLPHSTCAFELLGLDFVLDANLRPWLLEVNASPSLAWAHQEPATAALMRSIKSQMLADMAGLLRLQDRFPASSSSNAWPVAGAVEAANSPALQEHPTAASAQHAVQQQQGRITKRSCEEGAQSRTSQLHQAAVNPLLLQAASGRYFADRLQVLQLVAEAEQRLQAAVAASTSLLLVQQQKESALVAEQQQVRQGRWSCSDSSVAESGSRQQQQQQQQPPQKWRQPRILPQQQQHR